MHDLVFLRRKLHNAFKLFIKVGEILEATFKTNLRHGHVTIHKEFTCKTNPQFYNKLFERFTRSVLEVTTERGGAEICDFRNRAVTDIAILKMVHHIGIYFIEPVGAGLIDGVCKSFAGEIGQFF